jgi:diaminohydroxyphosphoribosylaminopyrimidine deaminase/5-amino-6-(5-phosphoribosylamino)uracil reductase
VEKHEKYMRRCIELAKRGEGFVAPNPLVGAVIVHEDKIIGEGYHRKYGVSHAEVNAIKSVKNPNLLKKSTIYVSLEPCSHFGKTPPCSDLIIEKEIPRVVIGSLDTFSEVNGKGIERLLKNGVDVETGVLEEDCRLLNKRFFTFHEKSRPYVVLKWAQTKDGYMDKLRNDNEKGVNWISSTETQSLVHLWRSQEMGILIGRKTAEADNPKLNVREVYGKDPIRIILDSKLKIKYNEELDPVSTRTIVFNTLDSRIEGNLEFLKVPDLNVTTILTTLYNQNISSIFVEGGAETLQRFIDSDLWDEIRIIQGENYFKEGLPAPKLQIQPNKITSFGRDSIFWYQK